jgi:phosphoribosylformimino-5-aminoimidazole carboxamide ribotide isomerase
LKIIPVIDVLNGVVVHAVRGQRERYAPLRSVLCSSVEPLDVAKTFEKLGFKELYVADLDAIMGGVRNLALYRQLKAELSLNFMVDAGIADVQSAGEVLNAGVLKVVIGTETLPSFEVVADSVKAFGEDRILVSLDIRSGRVLSVSNEIKSMDPVEVAKRLEGLGIRQVILLDLDRVGSECGVNLNLLRHIMAETNLEVLVGGGVRNIEDLEILRDLGVYGVLLATALHNGRVRVEDLKSRVLSCR